MLICPNNHDNLGGLSHCRVCGLPLLDLEAEFATLTNDIANRAEMGHRAPRVLLFGLGTVGANLTSLCKSICADDSSDYSYLAIDAGVASQSNGLDSIRQSKVDTLMPGGGTFCGIGEAMIRSDIHLVPTLRRTGLNHKDDNQATIIVAGIGGGIGSAASVLFEKCRQLNPGCRTIILAIVPGEDESFHNRLNAYYGLAHLLEPTSNRAADLIIAVRYDRMKTLRGIGSTGQELVINDTLAAFTDLLMKNLSFQYVAEVLRVNRSLGLRIMIPCLAFGRSMEIFGSLTNILESSIVCPVNHISNQAVKVCHLILRVPSSQIASFREEAVNEELWEFVRQHLPKVKAVSTYITCTDAQHDRIETCMLLGGGSATSALFSDENSLASFRSELEKDINWQTYGLSKESIKLADDVIRQHDYALEKPGGAQKVTRTKTKQVLPLLDSPTIQVS